MRGVLPARVRNAIVVCLAALAAVAMGAGRARAAEPFNGIHVRMSLITVDTSTASATVRVESDPSGSFARG